MEWQKYAERAQKWTLCLLNQQLDIGQQGYLKESDVPETTANSTTKAQNQIYTKKRMGAYPDTKYLEVCFFYVLMAMFKCLMKKLRLHLLIKG